MKYTIFITEVNPRVKDNEPHKLSFICRKEDASIIIGHLKENDIIYLEIQDKPKGLMTKLFNLIKKNK